MTFHLKSPDGSTILTNRAITKIIWYYWYVPKISDVNSAGQNTQQKVFEILNTEYFLKVFQIPKYQILSHEYFNYQNIKYVFEILF